MTGGTGTPVGSAIGAAVTGAPVESATGAAVRQQLRKKGSLFMFDDDSLPC
jgi:hypothetical protein